MIDWDKLPRIKHEGVTCVALPLERMDELTRELTAARLDANRYRWLRSWNRVGSWMVSKWTTGEGRYDPLPQEGKMDDAIDKTMEGEK